MALPDVQVGDPHVGAHNDERHSINGLLDTIVTQAEAESILAAAASAEASAEEAKSLVESVSPVLFDTDGVPYVTPSAGTLGSPIQFDTDGIPYLTIGD